jgi:hypothetical protein
VVSSLGGCWSRPPHHRSRRASCVVPVSQCVESATDDAHDEAPSLSGLRVPSRLFPLSTHLSAPRPPLVLLLACYCGMFSSPSSFEQSVTKFSCPLCLTFPSANYVNIAWRGHLTRLTRLRPQEQNYFYWALLTPRAFCRCRGGRRTRSPAAHEQNPVHAPDNHRGLLLSCTTTSSRVALRHVRP